jgi:thiol-disulfide isomerase/thioredoxin
VAPAFELPLLPSGTEERPGRVELAGLRGRVVLVNFWATWCEPCEREMPAMERLYGALPREAFELVAVAIDEREDDVAAFQARMELSFPIVLDPEQVAYGAYQTMGVPESLLIDREGRVVERYVGPRDWDDPAYVERIRALIGGAPQPPPRAPDPLEL